LLIEPSVAPVRRNISPETFFQVLCRIQSAKPKKEIQIYIKQQGKRKNQSKPHVIVTSNNGKPKQIEIFHWQEKKNTEYNHFLF